MPQIADFDRQRRPGDSQRQVRPRYAGRPSPPYQVEHRVRGVGTRGLQNVHEAGWDRGLTVLPAWREKPAVRRVLLPDPSADRRAVRRRDLTAGSLNATGRLSAAGPGLSTLQVNLPAGLLESIEQFGDPLGGGAVEPVGHGNLPAEGQACEAPETNPQDPDVHVPPAALSEARAEIAHQPRGRNQCVGVHTNVGELLLDPLLGRGMQLTEPRRPAETAHIRRPPRKAPAEKRPGRIHESLLPGRTTAEQPRDEPRRVRPGRA
jgi:hypothetical protein